MRTLLAAALLAPLSLAPLSLAAQSPAAPPAASPLEREVAATIHEVWDSFAKQDAARHVPLLVDGMLSVGPWGVAEVRHADVAGLLKGCATRAWSTSGLKVREVAPDVVVAAYTITVDQTCDGKPQPRVHHVGSTMKRLGGRWVLVLHQESLPQP
jgi:hypothetical protein